MAVSKSQLRQLKQLRLYEQRVSRMHEKSILECYMALSKGIEEKYLKSDIKDFDDVVDSVFKPRLQKALYKIAEWNVDDFIKYFVDKFKRTINFEDFQVIKSKLLNKMLKKYTAETVRNVTDTTKQILKDRLTKYTQQGLNFRDVVKNIVAETKGEIGVSRAKIIARTETSKAISITNYDTAVGAGLKNKTWIYTFGSVKKRAFHEVMNGKTIPIKDKFKVQGEGNVSAVEIRFPKDPLCRVAGQIISCACQIIYT